MVDAERLTNEALDSGKKVTGRNVMNMLRRFKMKTTRRSKLLRVNFMEPIVFEFISDDSDFGTDDNSENDVVMFI